jgi:hypothetical protein
MTRIKKTPPHQAIHICFKFSAPLATFGFSQNQKKIENYGLLVSMYYLNIDKK